MVSWAIRARLSGRKAIKRGHVMVTIGKFDNNDTWILKRCLKNFTERCRLIDLLVTRMGQLGDAIDQFCHDLAKFCGNFFLYLVSSITSCSSAAMSV